MLSKIPAMNPTYPVVGSNLAVLGKSTSEILKITEKTAKELGPIWRFDMSPFLFAVFISDPKALENLLSNTNLISKGIEYDFLKNWLGDGKNG
jgi:cytochrome P450 family 4